MRKCAVVIDESKCYISRIENLIQLPEVLFYLKPAASLPRDYEKPVLITNVLSFIFFGLTLGVLGFLYTIFGWITPLPYVLVIALTFLTIPAFNRWISHKIGRVAFCLIPVWLTMFVTIYFKLNVDTTLASISYYDSRFILMAATILPGIVFRLDERPQLFLCIGSISIFIFFFDPIHQLFGAGYYQRGFSDPSYQYLNYIVSVTHSVLLFGILLLKSVLERSEREVVYQNIELIEKQNEIEAQHEELLQHQEEMLASAEKLEQANKLIVDQQRELERYNNTLEALVEEKNSALIMTNEELVKYNNELLQFSYTVSHNLRGPVARLLGLTRLLNKPDAEEREKLQDLILRSSEELDEILKDLSLIIDIRNDIYSVREKVSLQEELNKAVSLVGDNARAVHRFDVDFSDAPFIFGVRPMIQSIFYNLISNAIKYQSPERKLQLAIRSTRAADNSTRITVTDNGLGIDLKTQEKNLFKLYKRFHTHVPGKGLGLYLVKTQVETLGGSITVSSEVDAGTSFTIDLLPPEQIERQIFYEHDSASLFFDGNLNIIVIDWKRQVTSKEYRDAFSAVLSSLNVYHCAGWISDVRNQGEIERHDQIWFTDTILPQLAEAGLKFVALLGPPQNHYFELLGMLSKKHGIDVRTFSKFDEARIWMEAVVEPLPVVS